MKEAKPFIKWVGGKTQLLKSIESKLPEDFKQRKDITYIEPFVGGGAVLFWMLRNFDNIKRAIINDINPDLTTAYTVIKNKPYELIEILSKIESDFFANKSEEEKKVFFLRQREIFNTQNICEIERTALFMFLNRTCFNGLYRVNKKGLFNVPFGRYKNPKICDKQTILADSKVLQKVEILTGDFQHTLDYISGETFFYMDPPYKPISKTSSFTTYTKQDFTDLDQIRLGNFCEKIHDNGCHFILSNSDLKNSNPDDNFFDDMYNDFSIERVFASRMINSKSTKRGKVSEILVSNINIQPCL